MSEHKAKIIWVRGSQSFLDNRYSRVHTWKFDGDFEIEASSSPLVVPLPYSNPAAIDPEEAFVASVSSCHMLWFLAIAAKKKFCVDSYMDEAKGLMKKNSNGFFYISDIVLQPVVVFSGDNIPTHQEQASMHHDAHAQCFIANSIKSNVQCNPVLYTNE